MTRVFLASVLLLAACGNSVEVKPGNVGLRWESGFFSGAGLMKDQTYGPGLHRLDLYHDLKQVVCLDSRMEESNMPVVTAGGSKVVVDAYVVFRAKCDSPEDLYDIITQVPQITEFGGWAGNLTQDITEPPELYIRYIRDNLRVAVREAIVGVPLLEVNAKRSQINEEATRLLLQKVEEGGFPVKIVAFNISSMELPPEIEEKLRAIEAIRLAKDQKEAELRAEEEEMDRRKTLAERRKEIVEIETEAALLEAQKETKLAEERAKKERAEQVVYTDLYFKKYQMELAAEVEKAKWQALGQGGNVVYMGDGGPKNFVMPLPTAK